MEEEAEDGGFDTDPESDAPWRPGYEGWSSAAAADTPNGSGRDESLTTANAHSAQPERADSSDDAEHSGSTRSRMWRGVVAGAVVLALATVAIVVAWTRWSSDDPAVDEDGGPTIARSGDEAWSAALDRQLPTVVAGDGVLVFASPFGAEIRARDLETGDVLWVQSGLLSEAGVAEVVVVGDRVIAEQRQPSGEGVLTAFDSRTGAIVWSTDPAGFGARMLTGGGEPALLAFRDSDGSRFELLDPADGTFVGSAIGLSAVTTPDRSIVLSPSAGRVALWSPEQLRFVTEPVSDFNLRDIGAIDDGTVGFDADGRIVAFDEAGNRTDELQFISQASGRSARRPALVGAVPDERFGIVASGSSVGFRVDDGSLAVAWQLDGRAGMPVATERGVFSLVLGTRTDFIIEVLSGDGVLDLGAAAPGARGVVLGHDGYLADTLDDTLDDSDESRESGGRLLEAFGYDGTAWWSRAIPLAATVEVVDGAVVIVDDGRVVVLR